jgi:hypothetical protein
MEVVFHIQTKEVAFHFQKIEVAFHSQRVEVVEIELEAWTELGYIMRFIWINVKKCLIEKLGLSCAKLRRS